MSPYSHKLFANRLGFAFAAVAWLALALGGLAVDQPDVFQKGYVEAVPDVKILDPDGVTLSKLARELFVKAVVAAGVNSTGASHERRSKAIALALQIDPENEAAIAANTLFRDRKRPVKVEELRTTGDIVQVLWLANRLLAEGSEADRQLAGYALDVLALLDPQDQEMVLAIEGFKTAGGVDWTALFPPPPPPPQEIKQMELEQLKFSKTESSANALMLVQSDGVYIGAPVPIPVVATRDEPVRERTTNVDLAYSDGYIPNDNMKACAPLIVRRAGEKWPKSYDVKLTAPSNFAREDLGTASVAAALALEGLVDGKSRDPKFAVTGFLNGDGMVGRCGGIRLKLDGAAAAGLNHIAIPTDNRNDVIDTLAGGGLASVLKVQIFTIDTYDEARALGLGEADRDFLVNESLRLFKEVADSLAGGNPALTLARPEMQQRLAKVLELTPNHLSARILQIVAADRAPKTFSLIESYLRMEAAADKAKREKELGESLEAELKDFVKNRLTYHPKTLELTNGMALLIAAEDQRRLKIPTTGLKRQTWEQVRSDGLKLLEEALKQLEADPELIQAQAILESEPLKPDGTPR